MADFSIFFYLLGGIALIIGLVGCVAPVIPGPPIGYIGLILLQCSDKHPFSTAFMVGAAILVAAVTLLDYIIPAMGTKKFGGSKYGSWGCLIGTFAGLFVLPPFGIIIMPFVGALAGELLGGSQPNKAVKAAFGSLLGFLGGVLCKAVVCIAMIVAFVWGLF